MHRLAVQVPGVQPLHALAGVEQVLLLRVVVPVPAQAMSRRAEPLIVFESRLLFVVPVSTLMPCDKLLSTQFFTVFLEP